jgi:hypothetical protein
LGVLVLMLMAQTGTLVVDTPHYGATISVDRRPVGTAPIDPLTLATGWHLVEVFARKRPPWSRLIFVAPGKTVRLQVRLAAAPKRRQPKQDAPAQATPAWTLTGRAGFIGARRGDDASLALQQRARLGGTDVLGKSTRLSLAIFGESRLTGRGDELLRRVRPQTPSRLRVDEAMVSWRSLRAGRLLLTGPASALLVLDGVEGALTWGAHRFTARGGLRGAPVGERPDAPVGGLDWQVRGDRGQIGLSWLHHGHHHSEASGQLRWRTLRLSGRTSLVDATLHRADLQVRRGGVQLSYRARGSARSDLIDPVAPLLARDPRPWHGPQVMLDGAWQDWQGDIAVDWQRGALGDRWRSVAALNRRVAAWNLGFRASGLGSRGPRVHRPTELHHQWRGALTARWTRRLDTHAGLVWQATNSGRVWLPEAGARLDWPLMGALSLTAEIAAQAMDPAVLPGEGLLTMGQLGLRLR